jgi:predicted glutamine amidotransferase
MSHLLGMSFDSAASPSITLKSVPRGQGDSAQNGWGFAWYPASESGAVVIKDPVPSGDTAMTGMLRDWERFRGTAFVCHVRGAAKRVTQEDTHPF